MKLSEKIAKLRKIKGLSQEELAKELNVSRQSVFKWESGENTPDLEKIKKLASLFNVSFDTLFDDSKDLDGISITKEETNNNKIITKKTIKFRETFDSGFKLDTQIQLNYLNKTINNNDKIFGYPIIGDSAKYEELLNKKNYSKTIRVQPNVLVDFYIEDKNKIFGFFFDGAPQFLCPFENFVSFGFLIDGKPSDLIKENENNHALKYDCSISYFDKKGLLNKWDISFGCKESLNNNGQKSNEELCSLENKQSKEINNNLNEISKYLKEIKEIANKIKAGEIIVQPIDMVEIKNDSNNFRFKTNMNNFSMKESSKKKKKIITLITCAVILTGTITCCCIAKVVRENQIAETNRNEAQRVIDLINNVINDLNLSSGPALNNAQNEYNKLTDDQKRLVTNSYKLYEAISKLEKMEKEKREEETKDDPTRTIVIEDLNGKWKSDRTYWNIMGTILWPTGSYVWLGNASQYIATLMGYNIMTEKMEIKIFQPLPGSNTGNWLDVSMTKSATGELTLYYKDLVFKKVQ